VNADPLPDLGARIVPPLEEGAWVPITQGLMYAWRQSIEQDRQREKEREARSNYRPKRPTNRSDSP
jgi:hypothetical protein